MEKQIEDFYRSLRGRRVAFIGTGVTNQQCIELFARCGARPLAHTAPAAPFRGHLAGQHPELPA